MAKMKLQKIADLSLKNMIITYHDTNRTRFDMDLFTTLFTEETQDHITNALQVLESDGLVDVFIADTIAYMTTLHPSAIRDFEEDTLLKKGYKCIKEIRSLI